MKKNSYTIYYLASSANPDNVRYIGYTGRKLTDRLKEHLRESKSGKNFSKTHKENWISKCKRLNNEILIIPIEENINLDEIENKEIYYINYYKYIGHNLVNTTGGGEGQKNMSDETKKKISKARLGTKLSQEHKDKISLKTKGINNPMYGKKHNNSTIKKISNSSKGKIVSQKIVDNQIKNAENKKPILKYSKGGNFICEYNSIKEANRDTQISECSIVNCCLNRKYRSAGGFIWKFKPSNGIIEKTIQAYSEKRSTRTILQFSMNMKLINEYKSATLAALESGVPNSNIGACCKGRYKQAGGFIWKYKDENKIKDISIKQFNYKKSVCQYTLDNVFMAKYESISSAVKATNGHRNHISECCKGKVRTSGGFIWKFKNN